MSGIHPFPARGRHRGRHATRTEVCEDVRAGDTLTPQQEDRIRQLVREECYFRDREALIKLTAMTLLLKLAGTVMLGLLLLAFRFL
ncbi:hypothetical protein AABH71_004818 [Salmonella enterica]|nr:hypothetical protein [Salmonella enterica subsp. enterica serovar Blockley]ECW2124230.1 hypothetical protein [Salmonella enterica]HAF1610040.1 hypothetical protein [Salmonella enterica]